MERSTVLPTDAVKLREWVKSLNKQDSQTACTVIITIYSTFMARTLVESATVKLKEKGKKQASSQDPDDENNAADMIKLTDEQLSTFEITCEGLFY